ncbi:hypothetical protein F4774DRAFT_406728 [Daldinia eschscholtzii]|nr:hypothetical protein F4774DRAFT_406728 [Daldinia eschscholtzii]
MDENESNKMNSNEGYFTPLPYLEASGQYNNSPQYPMLNEYSTEPAPANEAVSGEKRKSEEHVDASCKKRKQEISDEFDFSASPPANPWDESEMALGPTLSGEESNDAQEGVDLLSSNTSTQVKGHKSTEKQEVKSNHQEERESSTGRGYQHSHLVVNDTTASTSTSTPDSQTIDAEKLEQRRRLDEIVKDHIDDVGIVFDRPGAENAEDSEDNLWMMSGGLVTDPVQVQGLWDAKMPASGNVSEGSELKAANQNTSSLVEPSTFQGDNLAALTDGAHDSVEASSSSLSPNPSTTISSPTLHTKQARRRQSGNITHPTQIKGPLLPQYFDRVMPSVNPAFAPTTFRTNTQVHGSGREDTDEDEYDQPSASSHSSLRPASSPIPQPIDDLVTLVGIPGVDAPGTSTSNSTLSSSHRCRGRCVNRQLRLAEALARDRAVLQKEKELWTMMMGF